MSRMVRRKILNIIYWILLIIGFILLLWRIFGNSLSNIQVFSPFIIIGILKIWDIDNEVKEFDHDARLSFGRVGNDMNDLKNRIGKFEGNVVRKE